MQAADLTKYINNPQLLDKDTVKQLQKLAADFPYFQSAHLLLSMASKKWDASVYQQSLKKTAIVATNRAHLFQLIHDLENSEKELVEEVKMSEVLKAEPSKDTQQEDAKQELDILKAAEIAAEPIVEPKVEKIEEEQKPISVKPVLNAEEILEREIGKEVVNSFVEKEILKTPEFNQPDVRQEEPENFTDWLALLKKNNGEPLQKPLGESTRKASSKIKDTSETATKNSEKEKTSDLDASKAELKIIPSEKTELQSRKLKNLAIIDKIIESSPGLIRQKEEQRFYSPDIKAKESLLENEHLVTETLAKIYALQGSISKAIRAYEILGLKFPQKRAHFDNLIHKLKNNA